MQSRIKSAIQGAMQFRAFGALLRWKAVHDAIQDAVQSRIKNAIQDKNIWCAPPVQRQCTTQELGQTHSKQQPENSLCTYTHPQMWAKYKASYSASLSKAADYTFISLRTLISKRKKWCRELWQGQLLPKQVLAHLTKTVEFGVRIIPYIRRLSRILWDLCYSLRTLTTKGEGNVGSQEQSGPAYACCHFWKQHQGLLQQLLPACSIPHNTF